MSDAIRVPETHAPARESNWGRWGAGDERGALNNVGRQQVLDALKTVTSGKVLSLAQPHGPDAMSSPHRRRPTRFMDRDGGDYLSGARSPHGFRFAEDTVQFSSHSGTHMDALCHVWEGEEIYNGHPAASIRSTRGAGRCGAENLTAVLTRGVLVDIAGHAGRVLDPGEAVTAGDIEACLARTGTRLWPGDAVVIRTGWWEMGQGSAEYHRAEPGIDVSAARLLAAHDVSIVGADNYAVEQQPSEPGTTFPVHLMLLHKFGIPLLENLALAELSAAQDQGSPVFTLFAAPLPLQGSTASPVHPVAVL